MNLLEILIYFFILSGLLLGIICFFIDNSVKTDKTTLEIILHLLGAGMLLIGGCIIIFVFYVKQI